MAQTARHALTALICHLSGSSVLGVHVRIAAGSRCRPKHWCADQNGGTFTDAWAVLVSQQGWEQRPVARGRQTNTGHIQQWLRPVWQQTVAALGTNTAILLSQVFRSFTLLVMIHSCSHFYNIPLHHFSHLLPDLPAAVTGLRVTFYLLFFLVMILKVSMHLVLLNVSIGYICSKNMNLNSIPLFNSYFDSALRRTSLRDF